MSDAAVDRAPPVELIRGLAVLAEPPTEEHPALIGSLGLTGTPGGSDYADVFLFHLYPYASVHVGAEGMMGGEAGARVAGFWHALGYEPPAEPDHLAALLGLYAALAERELRRPSPGAEGGEGGPTVEAERRLLAESRRALLHEHLSPWVFAYLWRAAELAPEPYAGWARLLTDVLRAEVEAELVADGPLPQHLRAAPPLPDPRTSSDDDFLAALLAPVRSGVVFTRSDLARIASTLDVGLRAGERRYALQSLLAQDAPRVLTALAAEARRQAVAHEERRAWLGTVAGFHAERARSTAELLDRLAEEGQ